MNPFLLMGHEEFKLSNGCIGTKVLLTFLDKHLGNSKFNKGCLLSIFSGFCISR